MKSVRVLTVGVLLGEPFKAFELRSRCYRFGRDRIQFVGMLKVRFGGWRNVYVMSCKDFGKSIFVFEK